MTDIGSVTTTLDQNFARFDTAVQNDPSAADGRISQDDLQAVADNRDRRFSQDEVDAANFLLGSQGARSFLDTAGGGSDPVDGTIGRGDVTAAVGIVAKGGTTLDRALLDTAAGRGRADGVIGDVDLVAARNDPGISKDLKDVIASVPSELPAQTRVGAVLALRENAGDSSATQAIEQLVGSEGFKGLGEQQQKQALALFGGTNEVSQKARAELGNVDPKDSKSLQSYMEKNANPADKWRNGLPDSGLPDSRRREYSVSQPERVDKHTFPEGGEQPALKYTVTIDGESVDIYEPVNKNPDYSYTSVDQIAKSLAALPADGFKKLNEININPEAAKGDDGKPNLGVVMSIDTSAAKMNVFPHEKGRAPNQGQVDTPMFHEVGHLYQPKDTTVRGPFGLPIPFPAGAAWKQEWNKAIESDGVFPTPYAQGNYFPNPDKPNEAPSRDPGEDFAEAYMIYHLVKGTPDEAQMRTLMPERFAILDRMFP